MSVSPKYRTNFSVTDILSPLDESVALQPSRHSPSNSDPQNNDSSYLLLNSIIAGTDSSTKSSHNMSVPVSTPFGVHQLGMHPPQPTSHGGQGGGTSLATGSSAFSSAAGSQYAVNGSTELSSVAYGVSAGDVRAHPPAPWYTSSASDPRFASDYTLSTGKSLFLSFFLY